MSKAPAIDEILLKPARWQYDDYGQAKQSLRTILEEALIAGLPEVVGASFEKIDPTQSLAATINTVNLVLGRQQALTEAKESISKTLKKLFDA